MSSFIPFDWLVVRLQTLRVKGLSLIMIISIPLKVFSRLVEDW